MMVYLLQKVLVLEQFFICAFLPLFGTAWSANPAYCDCVATQINKQIRFAHNYVCSYCGYTHEHGYKNYTSYFLFEVPENVMEVAMMKAGGN